MVTRARARRAPPDVVRDRDLPPPWWVATYTTVASNTRRSPTWPVMPTSNDVVPHRCTARSSTRSSPKRAADDHSMTARLSMTSKPVVSKPGQLVPEPGVRRIVDVGHVMGVEDHPLHVALAVADADLVPEAHGGRA